MAVQTLDPTSQRLAGIAINCGTLARHRSPQTATVTTFRGESPVEHGTTDFSLRVCANRLIRHSSRSFSAELPAAKTAAIHATRIYAAIVGVLGSGRRRPAVVGVESGV